MIWIYFYSIYIAILIGIDVMKMFEEGDSKYQNWLRFYLLGKINIFLKGKEKIENHR